MVIFELFLENILKKIVKLFCIWLLKADCIMSIAAQVSDVAHGPLVVFFLHPYFISLKIVMEVPF